MIFHRKKPQQTDQQPKGKSFFANSVSKVKSVATSVKQNIEPQVAKFKKIQLVFSVIATLFFIVNSLFWVFKKWGDFGNLLWVMLAITLAYIFVFILALIKNRKDDKQVKTTTKRFKIHLNIYKALADVLFIVLSAVMLFQNLQVWRDEGGIFTLISIFVSGALLFVKLILTIFKLVRLNAKRTKLNKKQQQSQQTLSEQSQQTLPADN